MLDQWIQAYIGCISSVSPGALSLLPSSLELASCARTSKMNHSVLVIAWSTDSVMQRNSSCEDKSDINPRPWKSRSNPRCLIAEFNVIAPPSPCSDLSTAMSAPCFIPSNPDISGIGVRLAIYLQNLLGFVPAIWALWDGKVSDYELESAENQSTTNLVLAFAILISCIVQALTLGLTNYHASIVLSLSWMNNTNAFIYFLLYVQYKGQEGAGRVEPRWSAWISHIKTQIRSVLYLSSGLNGGPPVDVGNSNATSYGQKDALGTKGGVKILFKRIALLLGSLHLTVMAALGIWLWSEPQSFGTSDSSCAVEYGQLAILGARVSFGSNSLRLFSLALYSLFVIPGLNLLLPMVAFLALYFWHHSQRQEFGSTEATPTLAESWDSFMPRMLQKVHAWCLRTSVFPVCVGLGFLFAINVIFIADIELTLHRNEDLQGDKQDDLWGFGQILAVLLVLMPVRDLVETILARRLRRQELQIRAQELDAAWKGAIVRRDLDRILKLAKGGADPNAATEDGWTAVEVAFTAGNWQAVLTLIDDVPRRADINMPFHGSKGYISMLMSPQDRRTALEVATRAEQWDAVCSLIGAKADANTVFHDGSTALEVAAHSKRWDVVRLLINAKADVNTVFHGHTRNVKTVLHAACCYKENEMIHFLLENGADPNFPVCTTHSYRHEGYMYKSVLQYACTSACDWDLFEKTLACGADPDLQGYGTALTTACAWGNYDRVAALLEKGADPNLGGRYLPLPIACKKGLLHIVKLMVEKGADINRTGGKYGTSLRAACLCLDNVVLDIAEFLLERGANPNDSDSIHGSAIAAAAQHESNSEDLVRLLLQYGADPNALGVEIWTGRHRPPLQHAIVEGHFKTAQLLLESGADPNKPNQWGKHALPVAPRNYKHPENSEIIDLLLQYGAVEDNGTSSTPSSVSGWSSPETEY